LNIKNFYSSRTEVYLGIEAFKEY
jgi:hypothetical protein